MKLSQVIKTYRENHSMSMEDFAKKAHLSKGYISMLESGRNPKSKKPISPTLKTLKGVAFAMGIDLRELLSVVE